MRACVRVCVCWTFLFGAVCVMPAVAVGVQRLLPLKQHAVDAERGAHPADFFYVQQPVDQASTLHTNLARYKLQQWHG